MSKKSKSDYVDDEERARPSETLALSEHLLVQNDNLKSFTVKNEKVKSSAAKFFDSFKRQTKSSSNLIETNIGNDAQIRDKKKFVSGDIAENKVFILAHKNSGKDGPVEETKILLEQLTPPKSLCESLDLEKETEKEGAKLTKKKKINFNDVTFAGKTPEKVSLKSTASLTKVSMKLFDFSYVVLIGSFFAYMLASMLATCFGVFFESMESDLGWSRSKVALIGGVISAIQDLTGPISSTLTNKYGCRKTAFFGGIIGIFFKFTLSMRYIFLYVLFFNSTSSLSWNNW